MTRRENMSLMASALGAVGLTSCLTPTGLGIEPSAREPLGGLGLIIVRDGVTVLKHIKGFASGLDISESTPKRAFTATSPFRAASMSKVVVVLTAMAMANDGTLNLNADISPAIGMAFRHPKFKGTPITLQNLLSHQTGISDPDIYWTKPEDNIRSLLSPEIFKGGRPGEWFKYANINYGIAATVMEAKSGLRLDQLTQKYVLRPLGLDAGFNWADVSRPKRQSGATLYRKADGHMRIQADGPEALRGSGPLLNGNSENFVFDDYIPGKNGTLLSPQGGLRASLADLLAIAKAIGNSPELHEVSWRFDGQNGDDGDGHFPSFGPGLYVYPPELSPIPGQLMVGHHGEAYGLYGGLWHLPQINTQIVHVVTATPEPALPYSTRQPTMAPESRQLLDEAMNALDFIRP